MKLPFGLVAMFGGTILFVINAIREFHIHHWLGVFYMYWSWAYPPILLLTLVGWHFRHVR